MTGARLAWHEFRYERRVFLRDPQALFFAVGLPLLCVGRGVDGDGAR